MADIFKGTIQNAFQDAVGNTLFQVINQLATTYSSSIPIVMGVTANLSIDYSLTQNPVLTTSSSELDHLGRWLNNGSPFFCPFSPGNLPDTPISSIPFTLYIELHNFFS